MEKRNQDYCKADALASLTTTLGNHGEEHVCDDYGLLESLCSDTLSPNDARRFAQHLEVCDDCRESCASMFSMGVYDDAPFGDRMRALKKNPAAESDENWLKIAVAFDEELKPYAEKAAVGAAQPLAQDIDVAPCFVDVVREFERGKARPSAPAPARRAASKWRVFAYTSASVVLALGVASFFRTPGVAPKPVTPEVAKVETDWNSRSLGNGDGERPEVAPSTPELIVSSGHGMSETEALIVGNAPQGAGEPQAPIVGGATKAVGNAPQGAGEPQAPIVGGATKAATSGPTYEMLKRADVELSAFEGAAQKREEGIAAFEAGEYSVAVAKFDELLKQLTAAGAVADEVALIDAYWNLGVATAKSGDKAKAREILVELKEKNWNLDKRTSKRLESALDAWQEEK